MTLVTEIPITEAGPKYQVQGVSDRAGRAYNGLSVVDVELYRSVREHQELGMLHNGDFHELYPLTPSDGLVNATHKLGGKVDVRWL